MLKLTQYPGYSVDTDGHVYSCWNSAGRLTDTWHKIKPSGETYPRVRLRVNGKRIKVSVSVLVLEAFTGPRPPGTEAAHYPDPDPRNNRLGNLSWRTPQANYQHQVEMGTAAVGERHGNAKLSDRQVAEIRRRLAMGELAADIAERFDIHASYVWKLGKGKCRQGPWSTVTIVCAA